MSNKYGLVCKPSLACGGTLGFSVTPQSFTDQIEVMMHWVQQWLSQVIRVANYRPMEIPWNPTFASVLPSAGLLTPDGSPLVWTLNLSPKSRRDRIVRRVVGMDVLLETCRQVLAVGVGIYSIGSVADTLHKMRQQLEQEFPEQVHAAMVSLAGVFPADASLRKPALERVRGPVDGLSRLQVRVRCERLLFQHRAALCVSIG